MTTDRQTIGGAHARNRAPVPITTSSPSKWERRGLNTATITSLLTAMVAVGGLLLGIEQHLSEQRLSHLLRVDSQIRTDLEELVAHSPGKIRSTAKTAFLLDDLRSMTSSRDIAPKRERVTNLLLELIEIDCDFTRLEDVQLALIVARKWPEYAEALRTNTHRTTSTLYKYTQALRNIRNEDPRYFDSLRYDRANGFSVPRMTEETLFLKFQGFFFGFGKHSQILPTDTPERNTALARFQEAIANRNLTEYMSHL